MMSGRLGHTSPMAKQSPHSKDRCTCSIEIREVALVPGTSICRTCRRKAEETAGLKPRFRKTKVVRKPTAGPSETEPGLEMRPSAAPAPQHKPRLKPPTV